MFYDNFKYNLYPVHTMRKSDYDRMPTIRLLNWVCRLVQTKNKTIALFEGGDGVSPFTKVCRVLLREPITFTY